MVTERAEASYRRVHQKLWKALFAYSGDASIASDAEAEAFSQALARGEQIENVDAWVWRASFRIARGLLQRRSGVVQFLDQDTESSVDSSVAEFMSQLDGLSEQQRAIVALRYVGNYRPTEIAELIDSSPGSVRVQLHRAHQILRPSIGEQT